MTKIRSSLLVGPVRQRFQELVAPSVVSVRPVVRARGASTRHPWRAQPPSDRMTTFPALSLWTSLRHPLWRKAARRSENVVAKGPLRIARARAARQDALGSCHFGRIGRPSGCSRQVPRGDSAGAGAQQGHGQPPRQVRRPCPGPPGRRDQLRRDHPHYRWAAGPGALRQPAVVPQVQRLPRPSHPFST